MSILDGILKNMGGAPNDVVNLAKQVGLDPSVVEQAIAVLGKTHTMDGDTVGLAAEKTGLSADSLSQIVAAIGGEGSLANFASMLDLDKDGNPMDDIMGMASKFFGKN